MARFKRPFLFASILILLLLIALGFWFYRSTRNALERAEAFAFRRMTVAQQDKPGTYRFFYASNRRLEPGPSILEKRFTNERGDELQFGAFDTRIESSLGLGMIINPTDWFQNESLQINDVHALDPQAFAKEIKSQVNQSPHRALLVVVQGYRNSFPTSLRMTALVAHVLDVNAPVMMLDWPGDQGGGIRGYRRAQEIAHASGPDLADTLDFITREIQPDKIWLMANSMGAQVVADAFSDLYQREDWADAETEIEAVVLTAPDVAKDEFNSRFKSEINALADELTVYVSSNDRALLASRLVNRGRRLGESRINPNDPDQSEEAYDIAALIDPDDDRISLIDVTPVNRTRNFHNFSLETPEFFDDLFLRLTNEETPRSRMAYPVQITDDAVVWVLTRGR
jgi:esterase/lipase superfamily enzyme